MPEKDSATIINDLLNAEGFDAEGVQTPEGEETVETETTEEAVAETTETTEEATTETTDTTEEVVDEAAVAAAAAKATSQDEFDKILDEAGWRLPKPGQKENKIPQTRARARAKTLLKKVADQHGITLSELKGQLTKAQERAALADNWDQVVAAKDEEGAKAFLRRLALIHPVYERFVTGGTTTTAAPAVPQALKDLGPKPGPDLKYDDGTVGFSPDQLDKRDEWLASAAEIRGYERSKKEFDTRFGPIESLHKDATARAAERPKVEARIASIREQWGELFVAQERQESAARGSSDIGKYQAAHPEMPFEQVVAAVLLPKLKADRTTMRANIIKELNERKKVAKPGTSQATKTTTSSGPLTSRQIVERELERAGITGD